MADVDAAITFVLKQEDSKMTGVVTETKNDLGGRTRWGIAEHAHPELTTSGFFSRMSYDASLAVARSIYKRVYADPLQLAKIVDQRIMNAVLSFGVNEGDGTVAKVLQRALCSLGHAVVVDGCVGEGTLSVLNQENPVFVLSALGAAQKNHYAEIVAANPSQGVFINGWNNRVDATLEQNV